MGAFDEVSVCRSGRCRRGTSTGPLASASSGRSVIERCRRSPPSWRGLTEAPAKSTRRTCRSRARVRRHRQVAHRQARSHCRVAEDITVEAEASDWWADFVADSGLGEPLHQGCRSQARASASRVVHHAVMYLVDRITAIRWAACSTNTRWARTATCIPGGDDA